MKKNNFFANILILILGILTFNSCDKTEGDKTGFVTFGANYHIVNCISKVAVYIDDESVGILTNHTDAIENCGEESNITKKLPIGTYSYKIEIRPESGVGCTKDITGTFIISENQCEKIFIDYLQVFNNQSGCDQDVIISETEYQNALSESFAIMEMQIEGDCLKIRFGASGCDGSTWAVKLIDSGMVAESYPCQRTLRLTLDNKELCDAFITKEIAFNIKDLQIRGDDRVALHISGYEILYEY